MKKQPLAKLILVYNQLEDYPNDGFGYIIDDIVDYLNSCKCCAFCENYGCHDNCPEDHDIDFNPNYWCDYFKDKRNNEKYRLPNGTVCDFYEDMAKKIRSLS